MNNNDISVLNDLIKISKDGEKGFKNASEAIEGISLKETLFGKSKECQKAAQELQNYVVQRGGEAVDSGSIMGAIHRGLIDVKLATLGNDAYGILAECERGEDVAKAAYAKALKEDISSEVRIVIQNQYQNVLKAHDLIRDLRDIHKKVE